jgi:hypothetical protein
MTGSAKSFRHLEGHHRVPVVPRDQMRDAILRAQAPQHRLATGRLENAVADRISQIIAVAVSCCDTLLRAC